MAFSQNTTLKLVTLDHPINKELQVEFVEVTPAIAAEWMGKNTGNRNKRTAKIGQFSRDMTGGGWLTTGDTIKFDWDGRMIDGQHRCEAIITSGETVHILVVRGLDPRVQDVLDQGAKRSAADALRFNGASGGAKTIAAVANLAAEIASGRVSHFGDTGRASLSNSEVIDWYASNREVDHAAAFASKIARKINCTPSALAYAIYKTEELDAQQAFNFFNDLSEFRTTGKGDPRHALLDALRILNDKGGSAKSVGSQLSYIFRAWNAVRAGKKLSSIEGAYSDKEKGRVRYAIPAPK